MNKKLKTFHHHQEEEQQQDIISELPDALLHHILSLMPLKCAASTSILSNRWKDLWISLLAYATSFDFGEEFSRYREISQLVRTINRFMELHRGNNIEKFRLYIYPKVLYRSDIAKWIRFAAQKRVKVLDLHFATYSWTRRPIFYSPLKLPSPVFTCSSLTSLKLTECRLEIPKKFKGFPLLKALSLTQIDTDDDVLEGLLLNCPALEELSLQGCFFYCGLKLSAPGLTLKSLTLLDLAYDISEIDIHIPRLLSIHLRVYINHRYLFGNLSSLEEAIVTRPQPGYVPHTEDYDMAIALPHIAHVKILTICDYTIFNYSIKLLDEEYEGLPIVYPNLIELQMKLRILDENCLNAVHLFLENSNFPRLEKLFIELIALPDRQLPEEVNVEPIGDAPVECMLTRLKTVKITCFRGRDTEMRLVKFLLERAVVLESLFLVTFKKGVNYHSDSEHSTSKTESNEKLLMQIHDQLLLLPKASSNARVVLCEHSKDDGSLCPTQTLCWD